MSASPKSHLSETDICDRFITRALEHDRGVSHLEGIHYVFNPCNVASDVPPNLVGDSLRLGQILINY